MEIKVKNNEILKNVDKLVEMYKKGLLGGEVMPEDSNPHLSKQSIENYNYYTLPMALNYQRNSYKLWESANQTWNDKETNFIFDTMNCYKSKLQIRTYNRTRIKFK